MPTKILLQKYFHGILAQDVLNYKKIIDDNYAWMQRGSAETNTKYKQPIPYIIVMNEENKIFTFKRSNKSKDYGEKRLFDKWSIGVGGHIDKDTDKNKPVMTGMLRELQEEIQYDTIESTSLIGYVNHDLDDVGKVHFGVIYLARIKGKAKPKDSEIATSKMLNIKEIKELFEKDNVQAENWSVYSLTLLKKQFQG